MINTKESLRCPLCRELFQADTKCLRCGADLGHLMSLVVRSMAARQEARQALKNGDFEKAHELVRHAQQLCSTSAGQQLSILTTWLTTLTPIKPVQSVKLKAADFIPRPAGTDSSPKVHPRAIISSNYPKSPSASWTARFLSFFTRER